MKSIYLDSPYPQPVDGGTGSRLEGRHEFIDYLPNTTIRIWYSAFSQFYPEHWHDEMEIIYCQSGYYTLKTIDGCWKIQKGDILFVPGKSIHSLNLSHDCHGFVYLFNLENIEEIPSSSLVLSTLENPYFLKNSNSSLYHSISAQLEQIRNEYFSDNDFRELMVYSYMLKIFSQIGQAQRGPSKKLVHLRTDKQKEYFECFKDVLTYINNNYGEDITLDDISRKFGFSKFHFSRLFGQYTDNTFSKYLTYQRIKAAETFLQNSKLSITDISTRVGFNSLSTFSRAFKEKNRCTPSEYRHTFIH